MREKTIKKLDEINAIDLYKSGKTLSEISEIAKCGLSTISNYLKNNNIEIRKASKRETLRETPIIGTIFGQ